MKTEIIANGANVTIIDKRTKEERKNILEKAVKEFHKELERIGYGKYSNY